jgi:hypothetical protein
MTVSAPSLIALRAPELHAFVERDTTIEACGKIIVLTKIDFSAASFYLPIHARGHAFSCLIHPLH